MTNDPYATAEQSASVMAKNLTQERKAAIQAVELMLSAKGLHEQGVSDAAYTRGLHCIAVELSQENAKLRAAIAKALGENNGK